MLFRSLFARPLLSLFVDAGAEAEVMDLGIHFLTINASFYIPLLFVNIVRLCIQGIGYTRAAMFAGMFEMVARTAVALFLVPALGFTGACFANPAAWVMADLFLFPCYFWIMRNLKGRLLPQSLPEEKPTVNDVVEGSDVEMGSGKGALRLTQRRYRRGRVRTRFRLTA